MRRTIALLCTISLFAVGVNCCLADTIERNGARFYRTAWGVQRTPPQLTEQEKAAGWVTFVPGRFDGLGPGYYPTRAEIGGRMLLFGSPGEYEPATFAVYAAEDVPTLTVRPGKLISSHQTTIRSWRVSIRAVRTWPQRLADTTSYYRVIPELLEDRDEIALTAGSIQQFWVTVSIPANLLPDTYKGYVHVSDGENVRVIPLVLRVLPFRMQDPENRIWGIWPDAARWNNFSDDQILLEMRQWYAHGVQACVLDPVAFGEYSMRDGQLRADLERFEHIMQLYAQAGLRGPVIINLAGAAKLAARLRDPEGTADAPEPADLALDLARAIAELRADHDWPQLRYDASGDPGGRALPTEFVRDVFAGLRAADLPTVSTTHAMCGAQMNACIDAKCYDVVNCAASATMAHTRHTECRARADTYWWHYNACSAHAEGNLAHNRYLGGMLMQKAGATGAWAWTFQRPRGDAFDDFDRDYYGRTKDACITYPSSEPGGTHIPTLQWEGIREGIDDMRYVVLVHKAIRELQDADTPRSRSMAAAAQSKLAAITADLPWLGQPPLTNARLQVTRWKLCELLFDCADALGKKAADGRTARVPRTERPHAEISCAFAEPQPLTESPPLPVGFAPRIDDEPQIDGKLEPLWSQVHPAADLRDASGLAPAVDTQLRLLRGPAHLYIAFICREPRMNDIHADAATHDGDVTADDSVHVFIDANADGRTYQHFAVNSEGVKYDSLRTVAESSAQLPAASLARVQENLRWDPDWHAAVSLRQQQWIAEIAIPLAHFREAEHQAMNANFCRVRKAGQGLQRSCWSPTFGGFHRPRRFGKLLLYRPQLGLANLLLTRARWGRNLLELTIENAARLAELEVCVYPRSQDTPDMMRRALLYPGKNTVQVPYKLADAGMNELILHLRPLSIWKGEEAPAQQHGTRRAHYTRKPLVEPQKVTAIQRRPVLLPLTQKLAAKLQLNVESYDLLEGWPGIDMTGAINLGPGAARRHTLEIKVTGERGIIAQRTVENLRPGRLSISIATDRLRPGRHNLIALLRDDSPHGAGPQQSQAVVPFTVLRGPWY